MIGALKHLLNSGNNLALILCIIFFIYFIVLTIVRSKIKIKKKQEKLWIILYLIPLFISIIHLIIFATGSSFFDIIALSYNIYISPVLIALFPLVRKKKILSRICTVITIIICLISIILSVGCSKITNLTRKSLTDAYIELCDHLEENYILSDWKKIDYDKLKEEGLILVKEAEKTNNIDKYYEALTMVEYALHDGHAGVAFLDYDNNYAIERIKSFNNYGLSLITLDDGSTIAVNVNENLEIKDGDVITKWDEVPVNEAINNVVLPLSEGVLENELMQKTFFLAGVGNDTVNVTYINENSEEKTITLNKIDGELPTALTTFSILFQTKNEEYTYKMLNDSIGYIRITEESTNVFSDDFAYLTGNNKVAREKFRKDLKKLKKQGMTKLVIDIRNNAGGYEEVATALTSLFTKEKMYAFSLGTKKNNKIESVEDRYILADGEFSDLEIVVLTSMRCGSAGDGLVLYLSRLPNVTVAGLTNPAGINQEIGGYVFLPERAMFMYPTGLILDEDGNPNIDIDYTRKSRNPVDIKIPLTKENALKIFSGEDYELDWAINYLESK